jgi:GTPase SAR1 family protein
MNTLNNYVNELKGFRQDLSVLVSNQIELKNARRNDKTLNQSLLNSKIFKNKNLINKLHLKIQSARYILSHFKRGTNKTYLLDNVEALDTFNNALNYLNEDLNTLKSLLVEKVIEQTRLKRKVTSLSNYKEILEMCSDQGSVDKNKPLINVMSDVRNDFKLKYKVLSDVIYSLD